MVDEIESQARGGEDARAILVFCLDDVRFGLWADDVAEIIRAVWVTLLPGAPDVIEGVIDVRGELVPVLDVRRRFGLDARPLSPDDHMVLVRVGTRRRAVRADRVLELANVAPAEVAQAGDLEVPHVAGVARLADGLVLLHDLATFLSAAEARALDQALA